MKKVALLVCLHLLACCLFSQNAIVGPGFSNGWGGTCPATGNNNFTYLSAGAGNSYSKTTVANGTGVQYFRMGIDWSSQTAQWTITPGSDVDVMPNTEYQLTTSCTTNGAMKINVQSTTDNYVFKTFNAGTNPAGRLVLFRIQGAIRTITGVTTPSSQLFPGQPYTVTATVSGAFGAGQSVYLRYSSNDFATSGIVEMAGSGTTYTADIPASANSANATLKYYVFTSGTGVAANIANDEADWYTINLNNNGGSNYSYTVASGWTTVADGAWSTPSTWTANAVPPAGASMGTISIEHNVSLDQSASGTSLTISNTKTLTLSATNALAIAGAVTVNGTVNVAGSIQNQLTAGSLTVSGTGTVLNNSNFNHSSQRALSISGTFTIQNGFVA